MRVPDDQLDAEMPVGIVPRGYRLVEKTPTARHQKLEQLPASFQKER